MKHDWDQEEIKKYGNSRCSRCGIQYEYYNRGLRDLKSWTPAEIKSEQENYDSLVQGYEECKPR